MNIFEQLAEEYTYNGVVSLKAIDDDIVTLENQIDSYNATLREVQLRGKKPASQLITKIREAKIRLSLLKTLYKKESDKNTPNDIILNMLGISANNAKEVETPETAVAKREPKPQNFDASELEKGGDDYDWQDSWALTTGTEEQREFYLDKVKPVLTEKLKGEEAPATQIEKEEITECKCSKSKVPNEEISECEPGNSKIEERDEQEVVTTKIEAETDDEYELVNAQPEEDKTFKGVMVNNEPLPTKEYEVDIPADDGYTPDMKIVAEGNDVDEFKSAFWSDMDRFIKSDEYDKIVFGTSIETDNNREDGSVEVVPPPTIDDYKEPIDTVGHEEEYIQDSGDVMFGQWIDDEEDCEAPESGITFNEETGEIILNKNSFDGQVDYFVPGIEANNPCGDCDAVECPSNPKSEFITPLVEPEKPIEEEFGTYETFYPEANKIYASFDLSDYTDTVNTNTIRGVFNTRDKMLELTFTDIRDYPIFKMLMKEKVEHISFFKRIAKKPRSIFMYVVEDYGSGEKNETKYEFIDCCVADLFDSEYQSQGGSVYHPETSHECYVKFKYKKLKIE